GLGRAVAYEDVDGYAAALSDVLDRGKESFKGQLDAVRQGLEWPRVVERLGQVLELPTPPVRAARASRNSAYLGHRIRLAVETRGGAGRPRRGVAPGTRAAGGARAAHPPHETS